jgi:hypothetical protein
MQNMAPAISYGKIRASYGTTGNDGIADYGYLNTYSSVPFYGDTPAISPTQPPNDNYKWEINKKAELAFDIGLIRNRIFFSIVAYHNYSTDQLLQYELPSMTGFVGYLANLPAVVINKGLELELHTVNIHSPSFQWKTYLNFTFPKNYLKHYPAIENSVYSDQFVVGQPLNNIKALLVTDISSHNGYVSFFDANGNGEIEREHSFYDNGQGDKLVVGQISPKWYASVTNSIKYKNVEIDIAIQYINQQGYNLNRFYGYSGRIRNVWNTFLNGINPTPVGAAEIMTNYAASDAIVSNSSFLRLRNLYMSYRIPLKQQFLQIYIQAQNILTISGYEGYDPETSGNLTLMIPPLKTINIGAKIIL